MKWILIGAVTLWLLFSVVLFKSCSEVGAALDKCHPGLVTTEKDGKKSTTLDCTAVGRTEMQK